MMALAYQYQEEKRYSYTLSSITSTPLEQLGTFRVLGVAGAWGADVIAPR
jgi:hypothetical protein